MEFQLHDRVHELLKLLAGGQVHSKELALNLADYLDKNRQAFNPAAVPMHQATQRLATSGDEFTQRYDELKQRNARDVDAWVFFLAEIADKPEVRRLLSASGSSSVNGATSSSSSFNSSESQLQQQQQQRLTHTALAEMKEKVLKSSGSNSSSVITLSPNILSSLSKIGKRLIFLIFDFLVILKVL